MEMNPVGWFEIYVQDRQRAKKFYEAVLQMKGEAADPRPRYRDVDVPDQMGRAGAPGALAKMTGVPSGGNSVLVYFNCDDCAVEAGRVAKAGGKIHKDKFSIGQYGHIALAVDTEGNMFGLHSMK